MPCDYERICRENLEEYGKGTRHLAFLESLYSERTHFIFELLQNAEDALATRVRFELCPDRLKVWHNGRPFDERDVRGVCGIAEGTKEDDLTQIGKFGIGFKSVYAYTTRPEIHCGDEHFVIEKYIRPQRAEPAHIPPHLTTLFILPFDRTDVPASTACAEIAKRLANLNGRTMLFLRHIQDIEWSTPDRQSGCYVRQETPYGAGRRVSVIGETKDREDEETWLVFEAPIANDRSPVPLRIEAAFNLARDENNQEEGIAPVNGATLSVYFPTEKPTGLGFLLQGPYRTTPARDNVSTDDPDNQRLVAATAKLVVSALVQLKELNLLTVRALQTLPLRESDFMTGSMFRPVFEAVAEALKAEPLIPTDDGGFVSATLARISRGAELRRLFPAETLTALQGAASLLRWVSAEITQDRTRDLYDYFRKVLHIDEVTPEDIVRQLDRQFLEGVSDEWLVQFYEFLATQEALWRKPRSTWETPGPARSVPIIRLEDGRHVPPFRKDGSAAAYLEAPFEGDSIPLVRQAVVAQEPARQFLEKLGFEAFDAVAMLQTAVLAKYRVAAPDVAVEQNIEDLRFVERVLREAKSDERRRSVLRDVGSMAIIRAMNAASRAEKYVKPGEVYFTSDELALYFGGNPGAWLLSDRYPENLTQTLEELGVSHTIRVRRPERVPDWQGYVRLDGYPYRRGANGFDPAVSVDGLAHALGHPSIERSRYVWNSIAVPNAREVRGTVERSSRRDFWCPSAAVEHSDMGKVLTSSAWLPSGESFVKPSAVSLDDLPEDFERSATLAEQLGMKVNEFAVLAQKIGVDSTALAIAQQIARDPELYSQVRQWIAAKAPKPQFPSRPSPNPERRAERVAHDAATAPARIYEERTGSVRTSEPAQDPATWLRESYTNSAGQMVCQICEEEMPFRKRDGQHYFEAVEALNIPVEHHALFLALCPVCAAKYKEFVKRDPGERVRICGAVSSAKEPVIPLTLGSESATLRFVDSHFIDLQAVLQAAATGG